MSVYLIFLCGLCGFALKNHTKSPVRPHTGQKEEDRMKKLYLTNRVVLCKAVCTPRGEQVDDPPKNARGTNPRNTGQY